MYSDIEIRSDMDDTVSYIYVFRDAVRRYGQLYLCISYFDTEIFRHRIRSVYLFMYFDILMRYGQRYGLYLCISTWTSEIHRDTVSFTYCIST